MKQFIFIFVSITCLNLQATDLTDKLKGCLEDKRDQINQEKELESLKAVTSCLTDFVKKLESKSQAKTEVTNNTSIQFNLQSMYPNHKTTLVLLTSPQIDLQIHTFTTCMANTFFI